MNILITGGAGYIGSHTCLALMDKGHSVTILDNLITSSEKLIPKRANFIKTDISDIPTVSKIIKNKKFDATLHFAGLISVNESIKFPKKYYENNYEKTKIFLKCCLDNNLNNFIFSSSAGVYGIGQKEKYVETDKLSPTNPYAKSKFDTEKLIIEESKKGKLKFMILRYFNVAGADNKKRSGLISDFNDNLIKNLCQVATGKKEKIIINGNVYQTKDGTAVRDFIHVSDLANIHVLVTERLKKNGESNLYNCGYGEGYSVKEVVDEMDKLLKNKLKREIGPQRKNDIISSVADTRKFTKDFNWKPEFNNLNYILKTALEWEKSI